MTGPIKSVRAKFFYSRLSVRMFIRIRLNRPFVSFQYEVTQSNLFPGDLCEDERHRFCSNDERKVLEWIVNGLISMNDLNGCLDDGIENSVEDYSSSRVAPMLDNLLKKCKRSSLWKLQNLPPNYLRNAGKMGGKRFDYQFLVQRSVLGCCCFNQRKTPNWRKGGEKWNHRR